MSLKRIFAIGALVTSTTILSSHSSYEASMSESPIIFQIVNIKNKSGNLVVRLYDGSANFQAKNNQYIAEKIVPLSASSPNAIFVTFDDLMLGKYATLVFVDNNQNGRLDLNRFGSPVEQFTYSRRAESNLQKWAYNQSFEDVYLEYLGDEIRMILKVE